VTSAPSEKLRIVLAMSHFGIFARHFAGLAESLAAQGHDVVVLHVQDAYMGQGVTAKAAPETVRYFEEHGAGITLGPQLYPNRWLWRKVLRVTRALLNYALYLQPGHPSPGLRTRALGARPLGFRQAFANPMGRWLVGNRVVRALLRAVEKIAPLDRGIVQQLLEYAPDVIVISPYIYLQSNQAEYAKAARSLGIPVVVAVASWDNLTTKGAFHVEPDLTLVWNQPMADEAEQIHGVPPERIRVTGAPTFDFSFSMLQTRDGKEFRAEVGLQPGQPFVLYLASSRTIAEDEVPVVRRLLAALRERPETRDVAVLVRPHPLNGGIWRDVAENGLVVWPKEGSSTDTQAAREDYYDTMFHCVATIGVNTSASLEAAIVDKPCLSIVTDEYAKTQSELGHFAHLLKGGFLELSSTVEEAAGTLASVLAGHDSKQAARKRFVADFIRPCGLDTPAAEIMGRCITDAAAGAAVANTNEEQGQDASVWWRAKTLLSDHRLTSSLYRRASVAYTPVRVATDRLRPARYARKIDKIIGSGRPIIAGPWLSEVGFEVLYWIPFLRYLREEHGMGSSRVSVVSRGGVRSWYGELGEGYFDVLESISPKAFKERNDVRAASRSTQKQTYVSSFDRDVLARARDALGLDDALVIHPELMYLLFQGFWEGFASETRVTDHSRYASFQAPALSDPVAAALPKEYIAVKFYTSDAFPDASKARDFVVRMVQRLAEEADVVLLGTNIDLGDHTDLGAETSGRIHTVDHLMTPANNLDIQTQVLSGARAFVGTYGGFSYLPPFYSVPTVSFYGDGYLNEHHLDVAKRVFAGPVPASYAAMHLDDPRAGELIDRLFDAHGQQLGA
jgi:hypothetical protein